LVRAYANLANELLQAGYTADEALIIKQEVEHYSKVRQEIKLNSKDEVDMKQYEPAMRRLLDMYIHAEPSEKLIDFEKLGLIELVVEKSKQFPVDDKETKVPESMAETIESNMRKVIIDEQPINPKYYEKMSDLLTALILQRRADAITYQEYLEKVKKLAENITKPSTAKSYPSSINTLAKQALFDNLDSNEDLVNRIDDKIKQTKKADWKNNRIKLRDVENVVKEQVGEYKVNLSNLMNLIKNQTEYDWYE